MSITLPPLPEPTMTWTMRRDSAGTGYYTTDQLRARDLEVARAVREACREACVAQASRWHPSPDRPSSRDIYIVHECAQAISALKIEGANDK